MSDRRECLIGTKNFAREKILYYMRSLIVSHAVRRLKGDVKVHGAFSSTTRRTFYSFDGINLVNDLEYCSQATYFIQTTRKG